MTSSLNAKENLADENKAKFLWPPRRPSILSQNVSLLPEAWSPFSFPKSIRSLNANPTVHISHHGLISSLISSLSSLPEEPGFEFFLSDLSLRSRFLPCGACRQSRPTALTWWPTLENQARLTGSKAQAWSPGNRALHMLRLERGTRPCSSNVLLSLNASDGYSIAVQSGRAAAHTNGRTQRPQAVDGSAEPKSECACSHTWGKNQPHIITDPSNHPAAAPRLSLVRSAQEEKLISPQNPSRVESVGSVDANCSTCVFNQGNREEWTERQTDCKARNTSDVR